MFITFLSNYFYTVYMLSTEYTSIRVRRTTKELLDKLLIKLENKLGRRLDYDEVIRIIVLQSLGRKPEYLLKLFENPIEGYDSLEAWKLLVEERRRDDRFERFR